MKVNLLGKFKWYIVGFILVAIMLSASLSFCTWDSLSLQAKLKNNGSGSYYKMYKVADDINDNKIADVGDIVTFGNYYQELTDDGNVADKTTIRWIVVHKENNQLTLLAEKVMAFGSFWGTWYYTSSNAQHIGVWGAPSIADQTNYTDYSQSTVRAWLNSNYTLRNDGGTAFSENHSKPQFRGFLSEAFTTDEQAYIVDRDIPAMKGAGKANNPTQEDYNAVTDKVWLPSYTEVYGKTGITWGVGADSALDTQFSHFSSSADVDKVGKTTAFASTISNYTMDLEVGKPALGTDNYQNTVANNPAWWWLRSPFPSKWYDMLKIDIDGSYSGYSTRTPMGGVRPAICVPV